jgi:hypothetical protein
MNAFVTELRKEHEKFMAKQKKAAAVRRNENTDLTWEDYQYKDAQKYAKEYYGDIIDNTLGRNKEWI